MTRIVCKRYSALLGPYSEGTLPPAEAARTEAHLKACAACRADLATLQEVALLLRACKPAVPEPPADLWRRIQAEIEPAIPAYGARRSWRRAGLGVPLGGLAVAALVVFVVRPWAGSGSPSPDPVSRVIVAQAPAPGPEVVAEAAGAGVPRETGSAPKRAMMSEPKSWRPTPAPPLAPSQVAEAPFTSITEREAAAGEAPKPRARARRRPAPAAVAAAVPRKEKTAPPAAKPPALVATAASAASAASAPALSLDFGPSEPDAGTHGFRAERRSESHGESDSRATEEVSLASGAAPPPPDALRPGARIVVRVHPKPAGAAVASLRDAPAAGDSAVDAALDEQRQRSLFRYAPR